MNRVGTAEEPLMGPVFFSNGTHVGGETGEIFHPNGGHWDGVEVSGNNAGDLANVIGNFRTKVTFVVGPEVETIKQITFTDKTGASVSAWIGPPSAKRIAEMAALKPNAGPPLDVEQVRTAFGLADYGWGEAPVDLPEVSQLDRIEEDLRVIKAHLGIVS